MKKSELMSMSLLCLCGRCNISKKIFIFTFFFDIGYILCNFYNRYDFLEI